VVDDPEACGLVNGQLLRLRGAGHDADQAAEVVEHAGDVGDRQALAVGAGDDRPGGVPLGPKVAERGLCFVRFDDPGR
jgi:hypothetical protein